MSEESEVQMLSRFSRCWCEVESAVRVYFCGVIFNRSDVPDLVQRTAICAFRKFRQFDASQSFRAWVMGIACYEALGYIPKGIRRFCTNGTQKTILLHISRRKRAIKIITNGHGNQFLHKCSYFLNKPRYNTVKISSTESAV